uniref:Tetraspanin 11 n=1 Tax=Chelydra serpentina TaxID=8475 RepID=A0A8C3XK19_CHESE
MSHFNKAEEDDWMTVYLKYLLFVFNFFFWVGGAAVMAVGIWTLVQKSDYLDILASSTFAVSAYILIFAGGLVMITGFLGFSAIIREQRSCLSAYFSMLLLIFLIELVAGVLAYVYYQRLSEELKQHLTQTLTENYALPGKTHITHSVDRLQQDFKCCGSNSSADWQHSIYILSGESSGRVVPDSCCKTVTFKCGKRDHPSNIYKVEVKCHFVSLGFFLLFVEQSINDVILKKNEGMGTDGSISNNCTFRMTCVVVCDHSVLKHFIIVTPFFTNSLDGG